MQIYFHSCLCSYLPRVPILVEDTVYVPECDSVHLWSVENRSLKLRWQCVNKCLGLMWTWAVVKRNPESLTHGPFPPNTNSHSALLWVQLKTLMCIFYLLQHPMRPISGCQSEEAPSRLVASAVIFSSEREAPSGQAPHAVWHSRCHPNERMPRTAHGLETSLREVQFKKYVKVFFCICEMSTAPPQACSVKTQKPVSSFEPVIDRQESPHFTLRVSCNKNKPGPTWIRVSVTREAISFIFSLINTAAFSD